MKNRAFLKSFEALGIKKKNKGKKSIDRTELNQEIEKYLKEGNKITKLKSSKLDCFGDENFGFNRYQ